MNTFKKGQLKRKLAAALILMLILTTAGCGDNGKHKYGMSLDAMESAYTATAENELNGDTASPGSSEESNLTDASNDSNGSGQSGSSSGIWEYSDTENEEFEKFIYDLFVKDVTSSTINYHESILNKDSLIEPPTATLGDSSVDDETIAEEKKSVEEQYNKLMEFKDAALTEEERFIFECLKSNMDVSKHVYDNVYMYEPFSPMRGIQANLTTSFTDYRFDSKDDLEDYIALLRQFRDYFKPCLEFEKVKSEKGYFMSDATADTVIKQCEEFVEKKEDNYMIEVFNDRVDGMSFLTDEEKESYKERNKAAVLDYAIPAYQDIIDTFTSLKGTGKNDKGICYLEGGKDYYEKYLFPFYTGSSKTPQTEIDLLDAKMTSLITEITTLYYTNPNAYNSYYDNSSTIFSEYDDMDSEELVDYLQENCMSEYPAVDKISFEVDYLSAPMEKIMENVLAYYMAPPVDDEEDNVIKVNDAHKNDRWTTLAHEGCPGHMYQNNYFQSTNPKPIRSIAYNLGYLEGWAVYACYKSLDHCDFGGSEYASTYAEMARINEEFGYLAYARIDLGVNYEGWSLEDVTSFMEKNGFNVDYADDVMQTVIDDPAVYLSYCVGYYEMLELRNKAEQQLGSKFDEVEFHKVVLDAGPCQYENLTTQVDKYIEENK